MYGRVRCYETLSDLGVSIGTLANHLHRLVKKGLVDNPPSGNARYLNYDEEVVLTKKGREKARRVMEEFGFTMDNPISQITRKLEKHKTSQRRKAGYGTVATQISSFEKTFRELIEMNPTEPVLTSIAMYTELDSQLHELRRIDRKLYRLLSSHKLSLEIRNGRLASIAIPVVLKQQINQYDLDWMLGSSWSWMGTVNAKSLTRYIYEAIGLGLIKIEGNAVEGLKSSTTDTISWLAGKTSSTFLNVPATAPKASLIAFRETFNLPTKEELLNPRWSSVELNWASKVFDNFPDKMEYRSIMGEATDVLLHQTGIVKEHENSGRLVPRSVIRRLEEAQEIKSYFDSIMKYSNESNPTAAMLMLIIANPGITISHLHSELAQDKWWYIKLDDIENIVHDLARYGLIHIAKSKFARKSPEKLYAFSHIPFFIGKSKGMSEVNAVLKGMNPYIISTITEIMSLEERTALYDLFTKLLRNKEISIDEIESEYDKKFSRKVAYLSTLISPFTQQDDEFSRVHLLDSQLGNFLIDVAQYTLLTSNDALGIPAATFTDIISRYSNIRKELLESANLLVSDFVDRGIRKKINL